MFIRTLHPQQRCPKMLLCLVRLFPTALKKKLRISPLRVDLNSSEADQHKKYEKKQIEEMSQEKPPVSEESILVLDEIMDHFSEESEIPDRKRS